MSAELQRAEAAARGMRRAAEREAKAALEVELAYIDWKLNRNPSAKAEKALKERKKALRVMTAEELLQMRYGDLCA